MERKSTEREGGDAPPRALSLAHRLALPPQRPPGLLKREGVERAPCTTVVYNGRVEMKACGPKESMNTGAL